MRAGIGLIGLLVSVALVVWLFSMFSIPAAREGKKAQQQSQQIAGFGDDGRSALESVALTRQERNGKLTALQVDSVVPGGAMDTYYGLQACDVIMEIGSQAGMEKVGDLIGGDDMADAKLLEAYQRKMPLTVQRAGQRVTLPGAVASGAPAAAPTSATPGAPAAPAPPPAPSKPQGLQDQLNAIQDAAGRQ